MVSVCAAGMARRVKKSKMDDPSYRTVSSGTSTQLTYNVGLTQSQPYLDLAGLLSKENHRLYRQGMVYHVRIQLTNDNTTGARNLQVVKNTWAIRKAWGLAKQSWWDSTAEERESGIRPGRWNDFKVFMEAAHTVANTVGPVTAADGEWNYTNAADVDTGALLQFHLLGAGGGGRFGILREYDEMRDQDVDTPAAAAAFMPYSQLVGERSSAQAEQLQEEGDNPPYSAADLENGPGQLLTYYMHSPSTGGGDWVTNTQGYIPVPCGLIKLDTSLEVTASLRIDFKPGKYKGVHAEVMA